jgi:2,5-dihydroxypyridine 5,6-dioxygenase
MEALKASDLVIDLVKLLFSDAQLELQEAGCRVLLCVEPLEALARMFPTDEVRSQVELEGRLLGAAKVLRVTSEAGTDVTYHLGNYGVLTEYGYTDEPGRWDHWPSGFALTHGTDDGVNGTVVLRGGDIFLLPVPQVVRERVELTIEAGYITAIAGDNLDALHLRNFFAPAEATGDGEAFAVSHIGWGLNDRARWGINPAPVTINQDARAYAGNVLFSTGPNREVGGSRNTPFHLDIPLRGCSLLLDGQTVVDAGRVVATA